MKMLVVQLLILVSLNAFAQNPIANAQSNEIELGQQVQVDFMLVYHADDQVTFPDFTTQDIFGPHVIAALVEPRDTLPGMKGAPDTLAQSLWITSFDSGIWAIPPIPFVVNKDTVETNAFLLSVTVPQVDLTQEIKDIKPIFALPLTWKELFDQTLPYLGFVYVILLIVALIVYFLGSDPEKATAQVEHTVLDVIEFARSELSALKAEQLWQNNRSKEYYVRISLLIRRLLEYQLSIPALESTTQEINSMLERAETKPDRWKSLIATLSVADSVKYAKVNPSENEHRVALENTEALVDWITHQQEQSEPIDSE